ncbi:DUF2269 family protein [Sandarakinorhabdus sp.]|uniref:DUF2269 family protein n=1 Tax=Sandarakinorhabdus sp. TaxID=1916663 RepID=UPI00286D8BAD|nr:DUF2269 family protein [Sandarakinorhabdus sp.]
MVASYAVWKFLHITGVVMLMGNITVTAIWKFFADRDGRPEVLGFAQKLVTYTDWAMTVWGAALTMAGGYGLAVEGGYDLTQGWLLWSQILFGGAGAVWLGIIVPIQIRQAKAARIFAGGGIVGADYRHLSKRWLFWGLLSTLPLLATLGLMIVQPG